MKVGFITNLRAPYRTLQLNEYSSIEDIKLTAYYTDKPNENRKWKIANNIKFKEVDLRGYKLFKDYGYLNNGLINIVRNNDVVILGCYEQPTYILLSILCRIFNKPYILSFDGIGTDRIVDSENKFKKFLKKIVINGARYIMGNGKVSKEYFSKVFNYDGGKIYNQYLTVDTETINELYKNREVYRQQYRKALNIEKDEKVLIYSGRLISVKNVKAVIRALAELGDEKITLLITGGGELESEVKEMANILKVVKPVLEQINKVINEDVPVYMEGADKSFDLPEFKSLDVAKNFVNILDKDHTKHMIDVLSSGEDQDEINVYIGDENVDKALKDFSIITLKHRKYSTTDETEVTSFWFHFREYLMLYLMLQRGEDCSNWEERIYPAERYTIAQIEKDSTF